MVTGRVVRPTASAPLGAGERPDWLDVGALVDVLRSLRASLDDGLVAAAGALDQDRPDIARALLVEQCRTTGRWTTAHPGTAGAEPVTG